ncbi:hypothetical protein [Streptomyces sp. NBC_01304]|uniref:hypothetical protein n=1 Tax=Streptomyces sp. NBC_01304 TaxID=2903818 RepID=UPI002E15ECC7|nr:hypothetical protein OG430_47865 [Streptomyces sp. NBC_01304]
MALPSLPLAQHLDKVPYNPAEFHNRVRKSLLIAAAVRLYEFNGVLTDHGLDNLTRADMVAAAQRIGERVPGATAAGTETEDLIRKILDALYISQPTGRASRERTATFTESLNTAIAIGFDAFWRKFDGYPTREGINRLTALQFTAIAHEAIPGRALGAKVSQQEQALTKLLLRTICEAQPQTAASAAPARSPLSSSELADDPTSLADALTAVVSAAKRSDRPTIVVLNLPQ